MQTKKVLCTLVFSKLQKQPTIVVHTCNPRALEAEQEDQEFQASLNYILRLFPINQSINNIEDLEQV